MPKVSGDYQGIPILDGEFSFRTGFEPSRGWIRVRLQDLPGESLPLGVDIAELVKIFKKDAPGQKVSKMGTSWSRSSTTAKNPTFAFRGVPTPEQGVGLSLPWGKLTMETDASDNKPASKMIIPNIFWVEAVVEKSENLEALGIAFPFAKPRAVVRIELADERLIWDMGGYVWGDRNLVINEAAGRAIAGKVYEWEAQVAAPGKVRRLETQNIQRKTVNPIFDPDSIIGGNVQGNSADNQTVRAWVLFELIDECKEAIPGPPKFGQFTQKITSIAPFNVRWGGGVLGKAAAEDLFNRFNLVLAPNFDGGFEIYERGEKAFNPIELEKQFPGDVDPVFEFFENGFRNSSALQIRPLSVEVIGARIIEEIMCPEWINVIKGDGQVDVSPSDGADSDTLLQQQNRYYPMVDVLASWGYSRNQASNSLLANWDKRQSKAFSDCPPGGEDPAAKELRGKRQRLLQRHFLKSFMVGEEFRRFLPIKRSRAEIVSNALNLPNLSLARDATFMCDGWRPDTIRQVGQTVLWKNIPLEPVDIKEIDVDEAAGVITFKEPRGVPILDTSITFLDGSAESELFLLLAKNTWDADVQDTVAKLKGTIDNIIYKPPTITGPGFVPVQKYNDVFFKAREEFNRFIREQVKMAIHPAIQHQYDAATLKKINATGLDRDLEFVEERISRLENFVNGAIERFNLTEFLMIEPRIVGIWGWDRRFGRQDDYYRFRSGVKPEAPAFPLLNPELVQWISITGETNRAALDLHSETIIKEYLEKREKPLSGDAFGFIGFHAIKLSGEVPEVTFKISLQEPDATTETVVNQFQHGIGGRGPATATWTSFFKPVPTVRR